MENLKTVYIGLGSNKGDKLAHLQNAVAAIFKSVGHITKISKVYKTPAWGFDGDDFFNACITVETILLPEALLSALKTIETQLGRQKRTTKTYQSRSIDLDILFYDTISIAEANLIIPHPELHKRKFVLQPLLDLSRDLVHPVFKTTIQTLFNACNDTSFIKTIPDTLSNPKNNYSFSKFNYVAIEGNIGAGKTSLAKKIARDFNAQLILERFSDNPFLPKFYKNPERYAFTLELSFLADRYQQISDDLAKLNPFKSFKISDYDVCKSLIFSKINLKTDEFKLYETLFYQMYSNIPKPDVYVYLHQNTGRLLDNIKERGRNYETHIASDYLERIHTGYLEFLKYQPALNIQHIDITQRNFMTNRNDYLWVLEQILSAF